MTNTIARDFTAKTRKTLAQRGIHVLAPTSYRVTYPNGSWGYETAYKIDDNGMGRVRTHSQIIEAAA